MRPTHSASLRAPNEAQDPLAGPNGFDARQRADGHAILVRHPDHRGVGQPGALLTRSEIEELIRADHRKNEFIAILSHELRSPLGSIQNAVNVLCGGTFADAAVQRRMHELIQRQARHMALLVSDLFETSRIACGRLQLQCERIDACTVLRHAVETLEPDLRHRHQRLSTRYPESAVWLLADASRLEQVFVNLLGNASKYTDPDGEIAISVQECDRHVVVRIRDFGIGIAPAALPHIFDLFMQVDAAAPRSRSGLGVGLALVRTIVELHGGSVLADSAGLGQGSEFTVRLPKEA